MKGLLIALLDLFRWISARAKESQQIGELSRKITELQKYDDRLQKEVEKEFEEMAWIKKMLDLKRYDKLSPEMMKKYNAFNLKSK